MARENHIWPGAKVNFRFAVMNFMSQNGTYSKVLTNTFYFPTIKVELYPTHTIIKGGSPLLSYLSVVAISRAYFSTMAQLRNDVLTSRGHQLVVAALISGTP